jgi:acyl-CoA synthetase (AMP-forming)/AMP-acid ligase II
MSPHEYGDQTSPGLLDWVREPVPQRGLRFLGEDGTWDRHSYVELAGRVCATATWLIDQNLADGPVVVLHRTGPRFVDSFFGVLMAGATVVPLAPPAALGSADAWVHHAAQVIGDTAARLVLADPDLLPSARRAIAASGHGCDAVALPDDLPAGLLRVQRAPARTALLQFTSGSRGTSKGVRIGPEQLEANLSMICTWIGGRRPRAGVSWLPLYHDMGLVGGLLVPLVHQMDSALMRPEQFIAAPLRWLAEYGQHGGELMVMPNFGFGYVTRRIRPDQIASMDFSSVRSIITGAERVRPATLAAFYRLLGPRGLPISALQPAYGLAEATLAVTGVGFGEVPRVAAIPPGPIRIGESLEITGGRWQPELPEATRARLWHVSCGRPLTGTSVEIVDDCGDPLPDGHVGEIAVRGPSVALGYTTHDRDASTRFEDDRLFTGDAGFRYRDELFVLGRIGDSLQVRGRNLYVEDIEQALAEDGLLIWQRMVILAGYLDDLPTVCLLSEVGLSDDKRDTMLTAISAMVGHGVEVRVLRVPYRSIELTSSGKPRRRRIWQRILAGELSGELLGALDSEGAPVIAGPAERA